MSDKRIEFATRRIRLVGQSQKDLSKAAIDNAPIEADLEVVIRQHKAQRGPDANARMWAGPLSDIAEQAWVGGRQYSAEVWHEHFKAEYLPEADDEDLERLVKNPEAWKKWDYTPAGNRVLVGSTTDLTVRGFALYVQQIEAYAGTLGVLLHEAPRRAA